MLGRHIYRVSPAVDGRWNVSKEGEAAPRGVRPRRHDAVDFACRLAADDEPSKVVVENPDGTLEDERVFGVDPGQVVGR